MAPDGWLDSTLVLLGRRPESVEALVREVAETFAAQTGASHGEIEAVFAEALHGEGYSLGRGVAVPHTELAGLVQTRVCLVTLAQPLPLASVDGRAIDVLFFILSRPDPQSHLLLLAHLARLSQSRTLLDGLRRVGTVAEAVALIAAAEKRHRTVSAPSAAVAPSGPSQPLVTNTLVVISLGGEQAVDALLIALVDQGLPDACILEAQSLREAAAREVPLFTGFRDLFGDPGGRRLFLLEAPASRTEDIIAVVRTVCEEHATQDARVSVIPLAARWGPPVVADDAGSGGS